ncbi:unnamed protein product [Kuraishia capsulata CBS 1993]|uniref:Altered inheritance of mitochondria protein 23, mitochondrial n=1 Tax=Kuraishia capsulata CBS 1993 TaxID=1382522 RepID=W6MNS9_9ASCO|nr:uncharacterized protein KUCA_T00003913001 [Kuraishia capsulata CBS 1993]CDK27933.1 unnamed protein product [Kuraishia capsulata CBS 1993]
MQRLFFGSRTSLRCYSRYQKFTQPSSNRSGGFRPPKARFDPFANLGGSDRDREALGAIRDEVMRTNSRGNVFFISDKHPSGELMSFKDAIHDMDLASSGFQFCGTKPMDGRFDCAIIKLVDRRKAMTEYSDYLHNKISKNSKIQASMRQHRPQQTQDSKSKTVKLTWEISVADLVSHKWKQIDKIVSKGTPLNIFITSKSQARNVSANDFAHGAATASSLSDLESMKRAKVLDHIKANLDEAGLKYSVNGGIGDKVLIKINGS